MKIGKISTRGILKSQTIIVKIKGVKRLRARIIAGMWLFRLAGRIIGTNVEISGPFASGGTVDRSRTYIIGEGSNESFHSSGVH